MHSSFGLVLSRGNLFVRPPPPPHFPDLLQIKDLKEGILDLRILNDLRTGLSRERGEQLMRKGRRPPHSRAFCMDVKRKGLRGKGFVRS
jgi:hypothetical protein